ncbi:MAG: hypothetical protein KatS3mg058_3834 [Roseiflexus sp.]|nr:MAG: hypothetical protein KatS3mg058_3834 [Roseiflexus sp.]
MPCRTCNRVYTTETQGAKDAASSIECLAGPATVCTPQRHREPRMPPLPLNALPDLQPCVHHRDTGSTERRTPQTFRVCLFSRSLCAFRLRQRDAVPHVRRTIHLSPGICAFRLRQRDAVPVAGPWRRPQGSGSSSVKTLEVAYVHTGSVIPSTCDHPAWSPRAARGVVRDPLRFRAEFTLSEAKGSE